MHRIIEIMQLAFGWLASRSTTGKAAMGVLSIVVLATLILVGQMDSDEPLVPILDNRVLEKQEINQLQLAFAKAGLNDYRVNDSTILIPNAKRTEYLTALGKHSELVVADSSHEGSSFNPFLTARQQSELRIERKKTRLRTSLLRMPQIEQVWIEYGETEGDGPFRPRRQVAVINLETHQQAYLNQNTIATMRALTRGTFPGLEDDQIEIIDLVNEISYSQQEAASRAQQLRIKRLEQQMAMTNRITDSLSGFPQLRVNIAFDETIKPGSKLGEGNFIVASTSSNNEVDHAGAVVNHTLVGSNGHAVIRTAKHSNEATPSRQLENKIVASISVGIPEDLVRQMIQHQQGTTAKHASWNDVQTAFAGLRHQIEQTIHSQLTNSESGKVSVTLEPARQSDDSDTDLTFAVQARVWFERNWKIVVLFVFGTCAVLILRPAKVSKQD